MLARTARILIPVSLVARMPLQTRLQQTRCQAARRLSLVRAPAMPLHRRIDRCSEYHVPSSGSCRVRVAEPLRSSRS